MVYCEVYQSSSKSRLGLGQSSYMMYIGIPYIHVACKAVNLEVKKLLPFPDDHLSGATAA